MTWLGEKDDMYTFNGKDYFYGEIPKIRYS